MNWLAIKIKRFSTEIENMTGNMIYVYNFIGTFIRYICGDYPDPQIFFSAKHVIIISSNKM